MVAPSAAIDNSSETEMSGTPPPGFCAPPPGFCAQPPGAPPPGFRTQSQAKLFVVVCLCGGIAWLAGTLRSENRSSEPFSAQAEIVPIDINRANWTTFSQLDGIGPAIAFRIVADREHFGPFESIDDIQRVEGIGPLTLDRIRSRLTISHDQLKRTE